MYNVDALGKLKGPGNNSYHYSFQEKLNLINYAFALFVYMYIFALSHGKFLPDISNLISSPTFNLR